MRVPGGEGGGRASVGTRGGCGREPGGASDSASTADGATLLLRSWTEQLLRPSLSWWLCLRPGAGALASSVLNDDIRLRRTLSPAVAAAAALAAGAAADGASRAAADDRWGERGCGCGCGATPVMKGELDAAVWAEAAAAVPAGEYWLEARAGLPTAVAAATEFRGAGAAAGLLSCAAGADLRAGKPRAPRGESGCARSPDIRVSACACARAITRARTWAGDFGPALEASAGTDARAAEGESSLLGCGDGATDGREVTQDSVLLVRPPGP